MDRIILPDDVVERGGFDVKVTFPNEERRPPVVIKFVRRNWAVVTFADRLSRVRHFSFPNSSSFKSSIDSKFILCVHIHIVAL